MKFLPDQVVARLRSEMQVPDLAGTRYSAGKFLVRGGMGEVWLAEDSVLHRNVALKVLAAENSSADLAARLMREAEILARLEHPGIVPVHDAGMLPDGRTFYCMKYVEGQTLDQHIAGMNLRQRMHLLQRIAEPLAFAHSRGIIHRDLKPANIMMGAFGEVLILDWGLAKVTAAATSGDEASLTAAGTGLAQQSSDCQTTAHGSVLGTAGYMAPEQVRGDVDLVDQRTDVYGLGAIMGFLLREQQGMPRSETASPPLQAILIKATSPEMAARYASVQEMAADIGRYLDGQPIAAYRENLLERAGRLIKRNQVAVVLVLAYLVMRVLFILFSRH
ncbi:MAG TPA: serine/threonine-protein kinase [Candidatus Angelobacter sp.]|nr:serine/threonine-protein kinase [Candidatus Angelobacter sp.]